LQASAVSHASFCVHFVAKHGADLIGTSGAGLALYKVDEMLAILSLPHAARLEVLKQNKGQLVGALRNLLRFVTNEHSPLHYKWAEPAMTSPEGRRIETASAAALTGTSP
jgi:hypothetical protein